MAIDPYDMIIDPTYAGRARRCPPPPHCFDEECIYRFLRELRDCGCNRCYEEYRFEERRLYQGYYRGRRHEIRTEVRREVVYINEAGMIDFNKLNEIKQLGDGKMNIVQKVKALALNADDKLLRKYGVVDTDGDLTDDGIEILNTVLLEQFKSQIVEKVKAVADEEKKGKK